MMSIAATATFATAGPHAAVVQVNGEELGRARFYLMEGAPSELGRPSDRFGPHAESALVEDVEQQEGDQREGGAGGDACRWSSATIAAIERSSERS